MINMSLEFGSLRVFVFNYVFYSFGLVLRYFFRFLHLGDAKKELIDPPPQAGGADWNRFHDSNIDGFPEELANFLFWSGDFNEGSEGKTECSAFMDTYLEGKTECSVSKEIETDIHEDGNEEDGSVFMDSDSDNFVVHEEVKENGGETNGFVLMETDSKVHADGEKINEDETKSFVFMENTSGLYNDNRKKEEEAEEKEIREPAIVEIDSDVHEAGRKIADETENSVSWENVSGINEDGEEIDENETESSVLNKDVSSFLCDCKKIDEIETECPVLSGDGFNIHYDSKKEVEETEDPVFVENDTVTTTNKYECLSGKDISGFMEEPTTLRFSFREFYASPDVSSVSDNSYTNPGIVSNKVFSELDSEKDSVAQEEEEREESDHSNDIPFRFESEAFGGTDSSDEEDYFFFNENSVTSDSESESSCSSGLIWGNINKIDDSVSYQFLGGKNVSEGFESEILKLMMREERTEEGVKEKQSSCDEKVSEFGFHRVYSENGYIEIEPGMKDVSKKEGSHHEEMACRNGMEKTEEVRWEEELVDSESDEDDFEWEHDDLVEQLKLELKNSRQGGLSTILEEEEDGEEEEETKSPKVVEDLKPLKIEEKLEYKDQIDEIEKVYKSYAERMRKLDILNYQTMHALGLVQLKDPLKLISIPKSTIQGAKPVIISQNLWPRKATKITSDPLLKLVHELHRDLELVYVCQACLSWEILCWQHKKALELQQYDSQGSRRYNHVAGEFQLFQVLLQRFIENEPFQGGHRIQNYVKNRCVIRNLLHVPAIKDDSKGGEEDAIASGRLVDVIKESMRVFWEFVRADKDYGNVIPKVSKQIGSDLKDPAISGLLVDVRTQLQKKERKLKDIVRSGNCIVKKFQKHHEDQLDHEQLVAQVGLRLISRVVNMSHLTKEQVLWCNEKLHRIKFLSRKIVQVEPSFLLFPC